MKVYLAHHGNEETKHSAKILQEDMKSKGIEVINPFDWCTRAKILQTTWDTNPDYRSSKLVKDIVETDKKAILSCDALFAAIHKPSVGTSMEILFAYDHFIPVFILTDYESPWLRYHGTIINSVEELVRRLEKIEK